MGEAAAVWDDESLAAFLENPKGYAKGTKMSFNGLKKDSDVVAVLEYLRSYSQ
jgi:cytochrome c